MFMKGIEIKNLCKSYEDNTVLDKINISINEPGVYLLAGPNGSGKTTLFEIIAGLRKPDSGEIKLFGKNHHDVMFNIKDKKQLGFLCQQNNLRRNSTVKEELNLVKDLFSIELDDIEYLKKFNLEKYYMTKTQNLSGGTKRRLLIAMVFMANQKVVVLDEPASGLDTFNRDEIWNMISDYSKENIVIVSDHYLNQASAYSDYLYLLDRGNIILKDKPVNIKKQFKSKQIIKVRKDRFDEVLAIVKEHCKDYEVRISGTVHNIYINDINQTLIRHLEEKVFTSNAIELEDIYFYHTGKYSSQGRVN